MQRRKGCRALCSAFIVVLLVSASATAQEEGADWSLQLDAAYNGNYVWRGINLVDDHVFQPSGAVSYGDLTFSVWANMELTNDNVYPGHGDTAGQFTEVDYALDYAWTCGRLVFDAGAILYDFPNTGADETVELFGSVRVDAPLSPQLTVYQDVDEADGTYVTLSGGHTFPGVWQPADEVSMSLDLSGSVGFGSSNHNAFYYGTDETAFTDALLTVGLPVALGERWTLTPSLNYSRLLDSEIRDAMDDDSNVWLGLSLSFAF